MTLKHHKTLLPRLTRLGTDHRAIGGRGYIQTSPLYYRRKNPNLKFQYLKLFKIFEKPISVISNEIFALIVFLSLSKFQKVELMGANGGAN